MWNRMDGNFVIFRYSRGTCDSLFTLLGRIMVQACPNSDSTPSDASSPLGRVRSLQQLAMVIVFLLHEFDVDRRPRIQTTYINQRYCYFRSLFLSLARYKETMPSIARLYSNESPLFGALTCDVNWPFEHLNRLSRKIDAYAGRKFKIDKAFFESTLKLTLEELYEIGATALDSSLMLTFQRFAPPIDSDDAG